MCLGYRCLRNALISSNVFYVVAGLIFIFSSVSGKLLSPYTDYPPASMGVRIVGILFIILAFLGFFGALRHHQVALFFYMIFLFFVLLTQILLSYASMTLSNEQLREMDYEMWSGWDDDDRNRFMEKHQCRNFDKSLSGDDDGSSITPCSEIMIANSAHIFNLVGQFGLFLSITEMVGIWLTKRYRNQKDPRTHLSSAFL